jgi:Ankyrin repeat
MSTITQRHISYSIYHYLPIHWQDGDRALYCASSAGHVEVVKLLLDRGADIDATNNVSYITIKEFSFDQMTLLLPRKSPNVV